MKNKVKLFLILLLGITLYSCKKIFDRPNWDTNITAPLVKTSLGIGNIIKDSGFVKNSDNSISIVENELLYSYNVDSLVQLNVAPYLKNVKLASLRLDSQVVTRSITLGEIARQLMASSNSSNQLVGFGILSSQGQTLNVPPFSNITAGPFAIDISQYFQTANLLTGNMNVSITNGLPLNIQRLQYEISNSSSGTVIDNYAFTNLVSGSTQQHLTDLAGKTVDGNLNATILDMDVNGGNVLIDTNDAIIVKISITNITVSSATAVFPAQQVVNDHNNVPLTGMSDIKLKKAKIRSGILEIKTTSTIAEPVYFVYSIPGATISGDSFYINSRVPPQRDTIMNFDISGYDVDLTGENHDTINSIFNRIIGSLRYTGKVQSLSLSDSIKIEVNFRDIKPSYIEGYLGQRSINIGDPVPESVSFDLFNKIESGSLSFEDVKLSLVIKNGIGVDGNVTIDQIRATNKSGTFVDLNTLPISNHAIARATDNPLTPIIDTINLSTPASNAVSLLNILPNTISYQAHAVLNPSGNTGAYNDFAYLDSGFEPYLQLEVPLSLIANDLVLSDTTDFNGSGSESAIKDGNFTIHVENGFPLAGSLKVYFLDAGDLVVESLGSSGSILPAPMTGLVVSGKSHSKIPFHVTSDMLARISHSKKIIFKVQFSTEPAGQFVKIYSDYEIDFKMVGEFDYNVH